MATTLVRVGTIKDLATSGAGMPRSRPSSADCLRLVTERYA